MSFCFFSGVFFNFFSSQLSRPKKGRSIAFFLVEETLWSGKAPAFDSLCRSHCYLQCFDGSS